MKKTNRMSPSRVASLYLQGDRIKMPWEMTLKEFLSPVYPKGKPGWEVLYHGTYMAHIPSILRLGLETSRGAGVWASVKPGGDRGEALVQFQIPPSAPTANRSGVGHVEVKQDVPPSDFLSVHVRWPLVEDVEDGVFTGPFVRSDTIRNHPQARLFHEEYVRAAVDTGIDVPAVVLRDYASVFHKSSARRLARRWKTARRSRTPKNAEEAIEVIRNRSVRGGME